MAKRAKVTTRIVGGDDVARRLGRIERKVQRQAVKAGLLAAAQPTRDDAAANAPKRTGQLATNIVKAWDGKQQAVLVGPARDEPVFYALFQEVGTIHHPPQPFLEPAFSANQNAAIAAVALAVRAAIEGVGL